MNLRICPLIISYKSSIYSYTTRFGEILEFNVLYSIRTAKIISVQIITNFTVRTLKGRAEEVKERLNLVPLAAAVNSSHMQHPKDL